MTRIRSFAERDLAEVAALYERVIRSGSDVPAPRLGDYFRRTFLDHPWRDDEIPSLVHENEHGRVTGFLGSHVRRLRFDGAPIRLACSGQLVVAPEARSEAAGAFLLTRYLAGPQELTITDGANEPARRIWERLGGDTLHLASVDWVRVLRPAGLAVEFATRRGTGAAGRAARVPAGLADRAARRLRPRLRAPAPSGLVEPLTAETLVECVEALSPTLRLSPAYDAEFAAWLLDELADVRTRGRLVASRVRSDDGRPLGWYVAYLRSGGVAEAMQVGGDPRSLGITIDFLAHEAGLAGATAVRGRLEPRLLAPVWERRCLLRYTGGALVHSRSAELLRVVRGERALLTRLDGEWWMGHHVEPLS
jgi:hypothetical protein